MVQSPPGSTFKSARAAAAPAKALAAPATAPAPAAPALAGARLAASRSALRRSCREGRLIHRREEEGNNGVVSRPGFTHPPYASRQRRRGGPHAEGHAHVGDSVKEGNVVGEAEIGFAFWRNNDIFMRISGGGSSIKHPSALASPPHRSARPRAFFFGARRSSNALYTLDF